MNKTLVICLLTPLLAQCTHVSFRYTGEFETQDGTAKGRFTSIQSTSLYGTTVGCGLTFLLYGGFCWAYALVPTSSDKRMVRQKTEDALAQALGKPVYIPPSPIAVDAWEQTEDKVSYFLFKGSSSPATPMETPAEEPIPIEIPRQPIMERLQGSPIKVLFPFMTGVGLAYEWQSPWKLSLEAGAAVHLLNTRGLFAEMKYPIAHNNSEVLKLGLVAAQLEQRQHDSKQDRTYYLVERSGGVMLELESDFMPSMQFLYFFDKEEYEIIDFVINVTYRFKI